MATYKQTLPDQLLKFFRENEGQVFASGDLQRHEWPKWAYGMKRGLHTPRSVVRRLEEMCEEELIEVEYIKNHAHYRLAAKAKPRQKLIIDDSRPPIKDEFGRYKPQFTYA